MKKFESGGALLRAFWVGALGMVLSGIPVAAQLVVNEVDYDQEGTDSAEFVEIKNVSGGMVNLGEYELFLINGSTGAEYDVVELPDLELPPSGYFVVCADAASVANCDLDRDPDTNWLQNGAPDAVAIIRVADGVVVDTVSYEGDTAAPFTEGSGVGLEDLATLAQAGLSRLPDGGDTGVNNLDLSLRCVSPGAPNRIEDTDCAQEAALQITGDCPGEITIAYSGGTPGVAAGIVFSGFPGTDPLAAGPCAGAVTELASPQLLSVLSLDASGEFSLSRTAPAAVCGTLLQVVDGGSCLLSPAAALP